jgi:CheY-like chemotaxis protein
MLSRRLIKRGYSVLVADGGRAALDVVRAQPVDLILLDIEMPGMTGLEALKILRETTTRADLPVIMATARDQGQDIVEAEAYPLS